MVRSGGRALGAGIGPYIGGSREYDHLASFTLDAAPFLLSEASFAGDIGLRLRSNGPEGGPPEPDPFRSRLIFGVTFLKWLE